MEGLALSGKPLGFYELRRLSFMGRSLFLAAETGVILWALAMASRGIAVACGFFDAS